MSTINRTHGSTPIVDRLDQTAAAGVAGRDPASELEAALRDVTANQTRALARGLATPSSDRVDLDGGTSPTVEEARAGISFFMRGHSGEEVADLQRMLEQAGFPPAGGADGVFGSGTEAAVRAFQEANGLTVDGFAGQQTLRALVAASVQDPHMASPASPVDVPVAPAADASAAPAADVPAEPSADVPVSEADRVAADRELIEAILAAQPQGVDDIVLLGLQTVGRELFGHLLD